MVECRIDGDGANNFRAHVLKRHHGRLLDGDNFLNCPAKGGLERSHGARLCRAERGLGEFRREFLAGDPAQDDTFRGQSQFAGDIEQRAAPSSRSRALAASSSVSKTIWRMLRVAGVA